MKNYTLIKEEFIKEINSKASYLKHNKSGAKVVLLSNDDENKVFTIGFRTPPKDSTGVPHIMEHSTLCGSKKFPVKDPFVELIKSSLNTFINAMTYGDKTIYPVASCNDKDFANLMEVYMDAVFNPNVYIHEEIFKQEGWHYELDDVNGDIIYNGVVFNEMKGVFSSADSIVGRKSMDALFPDSTYGVESGGDPDYIPDLTYEQFKNFHHKYYSASNSYIILYGNMNMEERLAWLDEEYLSKYDVIDPDSNIDAQKPFDKPQYKHFEYPIGKDESKENKTHYSFNACLCNANDNVLCTAFTVLADVLFGAVGAPLKQALLDNQIGHDVNGYFDTTVLQPYLQIVVKEATEGSMAKFESTIKECLEKIVKEGINKQAVLASINRFEFDNKEANFGSYPKGLVYIDALLQTWLYDENDPFSRLKSDEIFKYLKEQVNTNYFEELISKYLLHNNHVAYCEFSPSNTLADEKEAKTKEKLAAYKASLSKEQLEQLVKDTKALKEYQATPSTKEELATIPVLSRSDINPLAPKMKNIKTSVGGVDVCVHDYFSNGIGYADLFFDLNNLSKEEVEYAGLLAKVLGELDTEHYKSEELDQIISIHTGGIDTRVVSFSTLNDECKKYFKVSVKYLYNNKEEKAFELVNELLLHTIFNDQSKLTQVMNRCKAKLSGMLAARGHITALTHSYGYFSEAFNVANHTEGISFYHFIKDLVEKLNDNFDEIVNKIIYVAKKIFRKENLQVSYTATEGEYEKPLGNFISLLYKEPIKLDHYNYHPESLNEGFKCQSQVQYNCRSGKCDIKNAPGSILPIKVAIGYDYLWNNVRVLGGAYGVMLDIRNTGELGFTSFRDPKLEETIKVYEGVIDYLTNFKPSEEDLTKFIISAIGTLDTPLSAQGNGNNDYIKMLKGVTDEMVQKERTECINATVDAAIIFRDLIKCALGQHNICVIGNEKKVEEAKNLFKSTKNLL